MSKNNDDEFLGGGVRFNEVGRKAADPAPSVLRPTPISQARLMRTIVAAVLLIVLVIVVYLAISYHPGVNSVNTTHYAPAGQHTLDTPPGF